MTISRCLDSIIQSGETEYEIIVIDDGSTDSTYSILEDYKKKYENLKVYHIENSGVSAARNFGIKYAQLNLFGCHIRHGLNIDFIRSP